MKLTHRDIGIITPDLQAARDFYVNYLGFAAVYASDWYIHLKNEEVELGLMAPGQATQPGFLQTPYDGNGVWLSFNVADMDAEYERLFAAGAPVEGPPQDRPWGERQFALRVPNGFVINLAKSIPPGPAFYA